MNPPSILDLPEPERVRMRALAEQAHRKISAGTSLSDLSHAELLGYGLCIEATLCAATAELQRRRDSMVMN